MLIVAFPSDLIPCPDALLSLVGLLFQIFNIFLLGIFSKTDQSIKLTSLPLSTDPMYDLCLFPKCIFDIIGLPRLFPLSLLVMLEWRAVSFPTHR